MKKSLLCVFVALLFILAGSAVWCAWELHRVADVLENCSHDSMRGRGWIRVNRDSRF